MRKPEVFKMACLQDIQRLIRKQIDVDADHPFTTASVAPVSLNGNERIIRPKGPAGRPPREGRPGGGSGQGRGGAPRAAGSQGTANRGEQRSGGRPQASGRPAAAGSAGGERRSSSRPWQAGRGGSEGGNRRS